MKLVLRRNHINRLNEYNQISLMGVNVLGTSDGSAGGGGYGVAAVAPQRTDLAFLMYTDPDIVSVSVVCFSLTFDHRPQFAFFQSSANYLNRSDHQPTGGAPFKGHGRGKGGICEEAEEGHQARQHLFISKDC